MWARDCEFMLGCWLAISPFVFGHPSDATMLWAADWIAASLVITLSCLSYWHPTRHAHLVTAAFAVVMILYGRFADIGGSGSHPAPGLQNHIMTGLLLAMLAILPNYASRPPRSWYSASLGPSVSEQT